MRLTLLLQLLTLTLHSTSGLAQPIPALANAGQIPTFDIRLPKANTISLSGTSSTNALPTDIPVHVNGFNGYTYPIHGTRFAPTITPGAQFDERSLVRFLHVIYDVMLQKIVRKGVTGCVLRNLFEWDHGEDLNLVAQSSWPSNQGLIWASTKKFLGGLADFFAGANGHREAGCCVNLANQTLSGRRKQETPQTKVVRSLPLPLLMNGKNLSLPSPLRLNPNVHVDIHASFFSRLDIRAVIDILVVTKDWALENTERVGPHHTIDHGEVWKTLADGVQIKMSAAPQKRLTYGLVVETIDRLLAWELDQHKKKGTARALQFGILEHGVVKGTGSIKKDNRHRLDIT
ncbi:MAG: hypothetical protein Q9204_001693 [Flavoplaca sp. TL-2023a]